VHPSSCVRRWDRKGLYMRRHGEDKGGIYHMTA
jgi:hypothetical protein